MKLRRMQQCSNQDSAQFRRVPRSSQGCLVPPWIAAQLEEGAAKLVRMQHSSEDATQLRSVHQSSEGCNCAQIRIQHSSDGCRLAHEDTAQHIWGQVAQFVVRWLAVSLSVRQARALSSSRNTKEVLPADQTREEENNQESSDALSKCQNAGD